MDHISPITLISSEKLRNLEEMHLDSIKYYRNLGILQDVEGYTRRLLDLFRSFNVAEVPRNGSRAGIAQCFLHMSLYLLFPKYFMTL